MLDTERIQTKLIAPACWMFQSDPPCFVLGGRFGDIIQLLPCFKAIYDRTSLKPVVICSQEYVSIFDGVSYVTPHPVNQHWYMGVPMFKQIASEMFGGGIALQFWHEPPQHADTIGFNGQGWITLQSHGHNHGVNMELDPNYGTSMARRCGFSQAEWLSLSLTFDKRDLKREDALYKKAIGADKRPLMLYNFSGVSSPFGAAPEITNMMLRDYGGRFKWVDLGKIRAYKVYDLLGLYDRAVGLLTSDTSTMHLAQASKVPYIGFTVDGWSASIPKGTCRFHCGYSKAMESMPSIMDAIKGFSV